ncbi:MAG: L-threonylcarbamoyladenylate synthase [Candidatus Micrarchaeota archaeon]|nr:L-threonylcarbamoyladenylate synthase [Candidatus Micrarchaeota archaeon]
MKTRVLKASGKSTPSRAISEAASVIKKGGLVAFPTETVYGLGANALNPKAVRRIFRAKKRPMDNPLIVHISSRKWLRHLAKEVPPMAQALAKRFWPGPLTMVLKKSAAVPAEVSGGLDSVAIRMPASRVALRLIKKAGVPIAAPSANIAGRPSPTCAKHVLRDLGGSIEAVIDGGSTKIGVESTVLDLTSNPPLVLRAGGITVEELEGVLGRVRLHPAVFGKIPAKEAAKSPGMKYRHYAPRAKLVLVEGTGKKLQERLQKIADGYLKRGYKVGIIVAGGKANYKASVVKRLGKTAKEAAKNLFRLLREFDEEKVDIIVAEPVCRKGLGLAVASRMKKAASKIIR